ncbi:MAG: CPBP family glutamic-type intramembrane protease [Lactobacillus sp.]|jgi:hypothetical protein|nr:CPBP family glutamic-type intramembrane protease [Lactobacillus sp.]
MNVKIKQKLSYEKRLKFISARKYVKLGGYIVIWFGLWLLTPGLLSKNVGMLVTKSENGALLVNCGLVLLLVILLLCLNILNARALLLGRYKYWAIGLIVLSALTLPFHYHMPKPILIYFIWMGFSVIWQNFITFGLFYNSLQTLFQERTALIGSILIFTLGHVVVLPDRFGITQPLNILFILVVATILGVLRWKGKNLDLPIALHIAFYYFFS